VTLAMRQADKFPAEIPFAAARLCPRRPQPLKKLGQRIAEQACPGVVEIGWARAIDYVARTKDIVRRERRVLDEPAEIQASGKSKLV
jgi:hypothetical protein